MERTKELYRDLLTVFDKLILPTHASCHVQYTLFYLCSFKPVSTPHIYWDQLTLVFVFYWQSGFQRRDAQAQESSQTLTKIK